MKNYLRYLRYILPFFPMLFLQWITGSPRYVCRNQWDKRVYVANIFRLYEYIFGRRVGIRKESMTWATIEDGKYVVHNKFYTVESFLSYCETWIRNYVYETLFFFYNTPSDINFQTGAIALDAATAGTTTATTPLTFSKTCTGSNLILLVGVGNHATTPTISTPTYNGTGMTLAGAQQTNVTLIAGMYWLVGPSTGSNTVSVGFGGTSPSCDAVAVSYSGALQTGQPDGAGGNTGTGGPNPNWTVTASNCWAAAVIAGVTSVFGGTYTSRGGVITLVTSVAQMEFQDSNATVSTGSVTFAWGSGPTTWAAEGMSFAPVAATVPTGYASWASSTIAIPFLGNDIQLA